VPKEDVAVERIIEFVTDPDDYPKADNKILKITVLEQGENEIRVADPRLPSVAAAPGLPDPADQDPRN
jgi:hypothetical protein